MNFVQQFFDGNPIQIYHKDTKCIIIPDKNNLEVLQCARGQIVLLFVEKAKSHFVTIVNQTNYHESF